jgi:hypothetical protein
MGNPHPEMAYIGEGLVRKWHSNTALRRHIPIISLSLYSSNKPIRSISHGKYTSLHTPSFAAHSLSLKCAALKRQGAIHEKEVTKEREKDRGKIVRLWRGEIGTTQL